MDVAGLAQIDGNCQSGPWIAQCGPVLALAKAGPLALLRLGRRLHVVGQLDNGEGQLGALEELTPGQWDLKGVSAGEPQSH